MGLPFEYVEISLSQFNERDLLWSLESLHPFIKFRRNLKLQKCYRIHAIICISLIKILSINHRKILYGGVLA